MANTNKGKKQRVQGDRRQAEKSVGPKQLISNLPERVRRRLDILTEDNDMISVVSDAIMLLWRQRYPAPTSAPLDDPEAVSAENQPAAVTASPLTAAQATGTDKLEDRQRPAEEVVLKPKPAQFAGSVEAARPHAGSGISLEAVRTQAQDMRDAGMSLTAIATKLNALQAPTLSGSGRWHHTAVKRLLGK